MTKENREKAYAHFRDLEKNYEAREGLDSGPTATSRVRKKSKESADALLAKHPELETPEEKVDKIPAGKQTDTPEAPEASNQPEEPVEEPEEEKKTKSKGKK